MFDVERELEQRRRLRIQRIGRNSSPKKVIAHEPTPTPEPEPVTAPEPEQVFNVERELEHRRMLRIQRIGRHG